MGIRTGARQLPDAPALRTPPPEAVDDLFDVPKRALVSTAGHGYLELRRRLRPRWAVVWTQLLAAHVALAAIFVLFALWGPGWSWWALPAALGGGIAIGFVLHYLVLFQHEAAHYNLAPGKRANDLLCDVSIGLFIGESIAAYRPVHLAHHRFLGTTDDTERSYFEAPNLRFALRSLTGIRLLQTLAHRARVRTPPAEQAEASGSKLPWLTLAAAAVNVAIVALAVIFGRPALAAAWLIGLVSVLPFLISLRQVLEHRSDEARPEVDYREVPHGATNRLFGTGPLASTLGGAGFNRHLLHHWDPGVSYTRLGEVEAFLTDTAAGEAVASARTTYLRTLHRLLRP
jgi:fatty acid desaturase